MRDRNVGSVVVLDADRPVAVMTDRDIALTVVADGVDDRIWARRRARHATAGDG